MGILRLGLGVAFIDILNVKDFGAVGDGIHDDGPNIQAAIDAAFGPASSPHGTNCTLNKPLFFPNGAYSISSPLVLTQVKGGHIYGSSQLAVNIINVTGTAFQTDGCEDTLFENLSVQSNGGAGKVSFELDWGGTGSVGLSGNVFINFAANGLSDYGMRIAFSGHGGTSNQFYSCAFGGTLATFVTWSASAIGNSIQGGSSGTSQTGYWIRNGQISSINDVGVSQNSVQDVLHEAATTLLVKGCRTEGNATGSTVFVNITNTGAVVVMEGDAMNLGAGVVCDFCHPAGTVGGAQSIVIIDSGAGQINGGGSGSSALLCSDGTKQGKVYIRGCGFTDANGQATTPNAGSVSFAANGVITWTSHGITLANVEVVFSGTVPSQITAGTVYYVNAASITTNTFKISATSGGATIDTTDAVTCSGATHFLKGFAGTLVQHI